MSNSGHQYMFNKELICSAFMLSNLVEITSLETVEPKAVMRPSYLIPLNDSIHYEFSHLTFTSFTLSKFTHGVLFYFFPFGLKLTVSSLIDSFSTLSLWCCEGRWIIIHYISCYQLPAYHILSYPSLVISLFSLMKYSSLFNPSYNSDHLCLCYPVGSCFFYSISSFRCGVTRMPYCIQDMKNIIYTVAYHFQFCSLCLY